MCIASAWDYDPTSKHHIMRILARHNDILWVNYHGTRCPKVSRVDLKDSLAALRRVAMGLRPAAESITQFTPLVIPGARRTPLRQLHRWFLRAQIRRAVHTVMAGRDKPIQVWSFAPDVPYLVGVLGEECFVYYCVDEYTQFEGFDPKGIADTESKLLARADVVVTTSESLWQTKRACRPDALLVRHGVDYERFATAWRCSPPCPSDLVAVRPPIFGFFGVIHHWIDRALIAEVARLRPQYAFVLIGECKCDVSDLRQCDNVMLLGRRPYESLPAYCAAFDAALLPFTDCPMTRNVNPVKMYEYLAAGLPIVSTPLPEAERFGAAIAIADTAERFAKACDDTLSAAHPRRRAEISRMVEHESWESKVEFLSAAIKKGDSLRESPSPASQPSRRSRAGVL